MFVCLCRFYIHENEGREKGKEKRTVRAMEEEGQGRRGSGGGHTGTGRGELRDDRGDKAANIGLPTRTYDGDCGLAGKYESPEPIENPEQRTAEVAHIGTNGKGESQEDEYDSTMHAHQVLWPQPRRLPSVVCAEKLFRDPCEHDSPSPVECREHDGTRSAIRHKRLMLTVARRRCRLPFARAPSPCPPV